MMYQFLTTENNGKGKGMLQRVFESTDKEGIQAFIEEYKHHDTYKTISLYKEPTVRRMFNIGSLIMLVIDVEVTGHAFDITKDEALTIVENMKKDFNKSIPTPSAINHSGRGLHIFFNIIPSTDIFKYQTVLKRLQELTDKLIAKYYALAEARHDPKINYHSLIRVEGTKNTVAGVYSTNLFYTSQCYELDYIIENYTPDLKDIIGQSSTAQRKTLKHHSKDFKTFKKTFKSYRKDFTEKTLQEAVLNDFWKLQRLRNGNAYYSQKQSKYILNNIGNRNEMIFQFSLYAKYYYQDTSKAYKAVQEFNKGFQLAPLNDEELNITFTSALKANYTTRKLSYIANLLELTASEMESMSVIFNAEEKRKRNVKKATKSRQKRSLLNVAEKQELIENVKTMNEQGLSYRQIASILKISLGSVHNYIKK